MKSEFEMHFDHLNAEQKEAVQTIEGPLLVLAGPGTGKTTLLTARIANILKVTDALPENILCLTFTDSAQKTMQSRLVNLIGQDAYRVHIHTFHSFGTWAMRTYPEYFGMQLRAKPADDVTRYEIFLELFENLDHHDPLSAMNEGEFIYLKDAISRISHLKQAGRTPDDVERICKEDAQWLTVFDRAIKKALAGVHTITKNSIGNFEELLSLIYLDTESKLGRKAIVELRLAIDEATTGGKSNTKPITSWKNLWLVKRRDGTFRAASEKQIQKLISLNKIYRRYQKLIRERALIDYDDMLLRFLGIMTSNPDFLAELQERFLYIMVDEYQDTNGVQDQILASIASNPVNHEKPNVMIVGDDDQAIYGFQGAYTSNVLDFLKRWPKTKTITLTKNYRSTPEIVKLSRALILQGENRLESKYSYIDKALHTENKPGEPVTILQAQTKEEARLALADDISKNINSGVNPGKITVLSTKHRYLEELLPYLSEKDIGVSYERRQDVLNEPHIRELSMLASVIVLLSTGKHKQVNELLPELLSYQWWGVAPKSLWKVSLDASRKRIFWLEAISESDDPALQKIADWLIDQAKIAPQLPLEQMFDVLIGSDTKEKIFDSPFRRHYFDYNKPKKTYLDLLTSLIVIRDHIREYQGSQPLFLRDFVNYVELRKQANLLIINDHPLSTRTDAVNLMTAFKAKGQEFEIVYILDGHHTVWGDPRERKNLISMPEHIAAALGGATQDERLRVFYVALTRAAQKLTIVTHKLDEKNNEVLPLGWLSNNEIKSMVDHNVLPPAETARQTVAAKLEWQDYIVPAGNESWKEVLKEYVSDYHLSPTHLNAFLDVSRGGPKSFLINQLLRFPHALGPGAAFGNAMHEIMKWLNSKPKLPKIEDTLHHFRSCIENYQLGPVETPKQILRGTKAIEHLYVYKEKLFDYKITRIIEREFASEAVVVDDMRLKGNIDLMSIDEQTKKVLITDYKTGKPAYEWPRGNAKTYEALKLHNYRQQLLFYKLLIDNSRSYGGKLQADRGNIIFLEPTSDSNDLLRLDVHYEIDELNKLKIIMRKVYAKIIALDLPDTTHYAPDISGIKQFEEDLINNKI